MIPRFLLPEEFAAGVTAGVAAGVAVGVAVVVVVLPEYNNRITLNISMFI